MIRIVCVAVALLALAADALACRCAQRELSDYFSAADSVVMGRLVESRDTDDRRLLRVELLAPPYKGMPGVGTGQTVEFATALSSASCGIHPIAAGIYILFGDEREASGPQWVDSCNGTRVHLAPGTDEPQGFTDVPARFVAGQLNGLAGMEVLRDVASNAPGDDTGSLIGLLDLKALSHGGFHEVYLSPSDDEAAVCIHDYADVETREVGYEQPAAVVYSRNDGWYRLRLSGGRFGWLSADEAGTYFPYESLPVNRLAYLNDNWSGFVWPSAGAGLPLRHRVTAEKNEYAVEVLESQRIGGMPWFRVNVLKSDPCSSPEPERAMSGWVPGYGSNGKPTAWFYSRGC